MIINIIDLIFINFIIVIIIFGSLINFFEDYLPIFIKQSFRYGKHCHKGDKKSLLASITEVPKSWFKHFYIFSLIWSWIGLILISGYKILTLEPPEFVLKFLDFIAGGSNRVTLLDTTSATIAAILLTMQCSRRFYETNYLQIFSSKSKINLSHYLVGYLHYFGCVIAILANSEGFTRGSKSKNFNISHITFFQYLCILNFLYGWFQQYKSNLILVNLRKDPKGKVISEKHLLPVGGYFDYVSSPHMLFEVLMYIAILGIIPQSITWRWITIWVVCNQIANAWLTHKWYQENFKNYPKRYAIFPFLL